MSEDILKNMAAKRAATLKEPMIFDKDQKDKKLINPMVFEVPTKSYEDKTYIIFIKLDSDESYFDGRFKVVEGRTACYRTINRFLEMYGSDFNVYRSKVLTETKQTETDTGNTKYYFLPFDEAVSVYAFCKSLESFYGDTAFDIDYYAADCDPNDDDEDNDDNIAKLNKKPREIKADDIISRQAALTGIPSDQLRALRDRQTENVSDLFGHLGDAEGSVNV